MTYDIVCKVSGIIGSVIRRRAASPLPRGLITPSTTGEHSVCVQYSRFTTEFNNQYKE